MKSRLTFLLVLMCLSLSAQQKGVSPISNQPSTFTNQNTYAVVVGISDYQDDGIPDLKYAVKDAEAFANFLQSPAGGTLDEDHLKVLLNEDATQAQFAATLDWLWEVAGENDKVIIYFSGHGDVERKSLTQPGYLLCWDAPSRVYMAGGAFSVGVLNDVVSTLSVQNKAKVVLVTDACRAGKLSGSGIGGAQATAANLAKQYANEIKILSCQPNEYSIEGEQWGGGRGAFSYHLLDGLYGMADNNGDQSVSLMEIGRYLEDHVTTEVEPHSQVPMTIGSRTEMMAAVFPDILAQIREGRKGQLQLFSATASKGMVEDVLAQADSNVVALYEAFQQSINEKRFLNPAGNCADYYYEKLSTEPQLERIHSTMLRNYVAALQDDAQQVMNTMLKSGLTEQVLKFAKAADLYKDYPAYLERAAELLGVDHYMYPILQARKYFFEGKIAQELATMQNSYRKALALQPDMAHAMVEMIRSSDATQLDTAQYYFQKSTSLIPSWVEPYVAFGEYYRWQLNDLKMEAELLDRAGLVDSTAVIIWYFKASSYRMLGNLDAAEQWWLKTIDSMGSDICFPCVYNNLGFVYEVKKDYNNAVIYFNKAIASDSSFLPAYIGLGMVYNETRQYEKALSYYNKAIQLDSSNARVLINLGSLYHTIENYADAEKYYLKALQLDSTIYNIHVNLGLLYNKLGNVDLAEKHYKKTIALKPDHYGAYNSLGLMLLYNNRIKEAEDLFLKVQELDPSNKWGAYNMACLHSIQNNSGLALEWLEKSMGKGIPYKHIMGDGDLKNIRSLPAFDKLMRQYFSAEYKD